MSSNLGRNDPCWCGSGRKYKYCHLNREKAEPVQHQEVLKAVQKAFSKKYCLHPQASPQQCRGNIVRAHTIQRSGGLSGIAEGGHVYTCLHPSRLDTPLEEFWPKLVGVRTASTFTGFCARHDDAVFAPIEKQPFQNRPDQAFLLAYRAICHELFLKTGDFELAPVRRTLDKGMSHQGQVLIQQYASDHTAGVAKALQELKELKSTSDSILLGGDYSEVRYYIVTLQSPPEILCSAVHQPEYDFQGGVLQQLGILDRSASWIHFSLTATDSGGAAVFSWLGDDNVCARFVRSFHSLRNEEIPHAIVRYAFEFFENTFFAPAWWERLDPVTQKYLVRRQLTELPPLFEYPRHRTCLQDDGIRAVVWEVISRDTNIDL